MALAKRVSQYPQQFMTIVEAFGASPPLQRFEIPFDTKREADALRMQFYGFRSALAREGGSQIRGLDAIILRVKPVEDTGKFIVEFVHRDFTPEAIALEKALAGGVPAGESASPQASAVLTASPSASTPDDLVNNFLKGNRE